MPKNKLFSFLSKKKTPKQPNPFSQLPVKTMAFKQITYLDENKQERKALVPENMRIIDKIVPESTNALLPRFEFQRPESLYTNSDNTSIDTVDDIITSYSDNQSYNNNNNTDSYNSNTDSDIIKSYNNNTDSDISSIFKSYNSSINTRSSIDSDISNVFKSKNYIKNLHKSLDSK